MYDRTARNPYGSYRLSKRRRRWESVSWWLSSIFAIALMAWALTWWFGIRGGDDGAATAGRVITFEVSSAENGQPLPGAQVSYPGGSAPTDANGMVSLAFADESVDIEVSAAGFEPIYGTAGTNIDERQKIALNPAPPSSTEEQPVTAPTTEAEPSVAVAPTTAAIATAPAEPSPTIGATIAPTVAGAGTVTGGDTIGGMITDANGDPIWDATILSGSNFARTAEDGTFTLANVPAGSDVEIWASGYKDQTVSIGCRDVRSRWNAKISMRLI